MRLCFYLLAFVLLFQNPAKASPEEWQSTFGCYPSVTAYPLSTCQVVMGGGLRTAHDGPDAQLTELISIEHWQSFEPRPDSSALVLYKVGENWRLEAFVWKYDLATHIRSGAGDVRYSGSKMMRSSNVIVSDARIRAFRKAHPFPPALAGAEKFDTGCTDGSNLTMYYGNGDKALRRARHVCQGRVGLDVFAEALVSLAIELDPGLASYADVFTIAQDSNDAP